MKLTQNVASSRITSSLENNSSGTCNIQFFATWQLRVFFFWYRTRDLVLSRQAVAPLS